METVHRQAKKLILSVNVLAFQHIILKYSQEQNICKKSIQRTSRHVVMILQRPSYDRTSKALSTNSININILRCNLLCWLTCQRIKKQYSKTEHNLLI